MQYVVRNLHTGHFHQGGPYWNADIAKAHRHSLESAMSEQRMSAHSSKLRGECVVIGQVAL